ncbi:hypothetical protein [Geomicrobium sp. JCM 19055]|uniref:hypothetical protein n=1 Tax=Geomicrobium sp. JCM 19055 TaxID=1460649 RepID=UPI002235E128|nr:hypothetical protein [Geomicrobium sp. JCM 19055]
MKEKNVGNVPICSFVNPSKTAVFPVNGCRPYTLFKPVGAVGDGGIVGCVGAVGAVGAVGGTTFAGPLIRLLLISILLKQLSI